MIIPNTFIPKLKKLILWWEKKSLIDMYNFKRAKNNLSKARVSYLIAKSKLNLIDRLI